MSSEDGAEKQLAARETSRRPTVIGAAGRRITLAEVAAAAGVSPAAASFVLAGRDDMRIAEATQQRVREVADELGYRPNLAARSLRTGRSGTIGFISDTVSSSAYAGGMVTGALTASREWGALLYIAETLGDDGVQQELLQGMLDRHVDGFILASMFTRRLRVPDVLSGQPMVLLNAEPESDVLGHVLPDERQAGRDAAGLLLRAGHRQGVFLLGDVRQRRPYALRERKRGIEEALREAGTELAGALAVRDWEPANGRSAVAELLASGVRPDALICVNDRLALGAYQTLTAAGLAVGRDVSVVSFDDSDLAAWLEPGLTSIALPHAEMGRQAVALLLADGARDRVTVRMPVVERASISAR